MKKSRLISQFKTLTYVQQAELLEQLKFTLSESKPILQHKKLSKECIYCKSIKVYKHGTYKNGGTRYRCQDCKKSYNELTGTSIHCIKKKELWDRFIEMMLESKPVRGIAKELKISPTTAFEWRHKILTSFDNLFTKTFKGVVETDDIFIPFNQKGRRKNWKDVYGAKQGASDYKVSVMMTLDRYKTYDFKKVKLGAINSDALKSVMDMSRFNKENIVCSDKSRAIKKFMKGTGLVHKTIISKKGKNVDGIYHVNTLNSAKNRYDDWVNKQFVNVSTKYLTNYLNWFSVLEILRNKQKQADKFWDYTLMDNKSFNRNKQVEENYQKFLSV
jgi:transposase-like protein